MKTSIDAITSFTGDHHFLGNFGPGTAWYDGVAYPSGEAAFQAGKFNDPDHREAIRRAPSPGEAKRLGRTRSLPIRAGWDEGLSFVVMSEVVATKFGASAELRGRLMDTGDAVLIEGNTWHDQIWGSCHCGRPACEAPGTNHLGLILMTARASFREA